MPKHWLILLTFAACSRTPSHERFPGPPGRTTDFQQAQTTKQVLGGFDPNAKKTEEENAIHGIIKLGSGLRVPTKPYVIFISARPLGAGGPPLAVLRMGPRKIPFRFVLSQSNVMIQGTKLEGFVEVTARIIQQNSEGGYNPLARQPGDLFGSRKVKVGAKNLDVEISEVVK